MQTLNRQGNQVNGLLRGCHNRSDSVFQACMLFDFVESSSRKYDRIWTDKTAVHNLPKNGIDLDKSEAHVCRFLTTAVYQKIRQDLD
ncbi:hypothetical protein BaRGS_00029828 [Batillaria attramentaria]|uniref:Uncharacterized protein n=1 Tax=Batillaria attramentaria TaxID=370345 RepID=A0ABD0JW94_9CAEN